MPKSWKDLIRWRQQQEEDWDLRIKGEQERILKEHGYWPSEAEAESALEENLYFKALERQGHERT